MKILNEFLNCLLIFGVIWEVASALDNTVQKWKEGEHRNSTESKLRLSNFKKAYKLYGGQNALINSICIGMYSESYYELEDNAILLNFSPQCFVAPANFFVDSIEPGFQLRSIPPTVDNDYFYRGLCVRPDCDINYHPSKIILNSVNYYDASNYKNDIALFKTKAPVIYDDRCGGPPLEPAWISCDKNGPPANYTDCFLASFGVPTAQPAQQQSAPVNAPINSVKMKVLSAADCQTKSQSANDIGYDPNTQICITDANGLDPVCEIDYNRNPFLFCKYWGNGSKGWNNGWKSDSKRPATRNNNGWGWNGSPKRQNLLAVGHIEKTLSSGSCGPDNLGVDLLVKYGAQIYRKLFSECGYYCSTELEKGYRCRGNPPKSLGPVYCYPEKIPTNNGWGSTGNSQNGWRP